MCQGLGFGAVSDSMVAGGRVADSPFAEVYGRCQCSRLSVFARVGHGGQQPHRSLWGSESLDRHNILSQRRFMKNRAAAIEVWTTVERFGSVEAVCFRNAGKMVLRPTRLGWA